MMSNRVALVTGGAKRVGAAIVQRLSAAGYRVAITYLNSEREAQEIRAAHAIRADLTKPAESVPRVVQSIMEKFGRLDLLVNNASIYKASDLAGTDKTVVDELMAIHYVSPLMLCSGFEKTLRANQGSIVNMLDLLAEKPWGKYLAYSASKAALWNLTLALAKELAPDVRVNGIAPGVVEWPANYSKLEQEKYLKRVPLGRAGSPADVAELVYVLANEGSYITGQIIRLDGGRSIT